MQKKLHVQTFDEIYKSKTEKLVTPTKMVCWNCHYDMPICIEISKHGNDLGFPFLNVGGGVNTNFLIEYSEWQRAITP